MKSKTLGILSVSALMLAATAAFAGPGGGGGYPYPYPTPTATPCDYDLEIEKDGPSEVKVGDFYEYEITITNTGTCDLTNIRLTDFFPEKVQFRDADPEPDTVNGKGSDFESAIWRDIDLDAGDSEDFVIEVHALGSPNRTVVNRACARNSRVGEVCDEVETRFETGAGS